MLWWGNECSWKWDWRCFIFITGARFLITTQLEFSCTNNTAEYEACITGLKVALDVNSKDIHVYGDSIIIITQPYREWEVQNLDVIKYRRCLTQLRESSVLSLSTTCYVWRVNLRMPWQPYHPWSKYPKKWVAPNYVEPELSQHTHYIEAEPDGKHWFYDIKLS